MNVVLYSQLSFEDKLKYIKNCVLDGVEVFYKNKFGFVYLSNDILYTEFYDEVKILNEFDMFSVMHTEGLFAHIKLKESSNNEKFYVNVLGRTLTDICNTAMDKYPNNIEEIFISPHSKDYR